MSNDVQKDLKEKVKLVRKWCLVSTTQAGSGHPTSCLSAADLATVLFNTFYRFAIRNPQNPDNDRFILSKGHAAPLLYTLYALSGAFWVGELKTLRKFGSGLEGHPTPRFPFTEAATGSLGQGLSVGAGMALAAKKDSLSYKTYVLLGDGELSEGSIWEAANFACYYRLDNLIAIADINRFGQSQQTMFGHHIEEYKKRFAAFGWIVMTIDGHNMVQIEKALAKAVKNKSSKPIIILAKTKKGKGISFLEDKDGWHGKPLKKEELEKALEELGKVDEGLRFDLDSDGRLSRVAKDARQSFAKGKLPSPSLSERRLSTDTSSNQKSASAFSSFASVQPSITQLNMPYKRGDQIATREVYGGMLAKLADQNPLIYALDAEVKNSTYAQDFLKAHPDRFIECFIAEQNMVGVALGLSKRGKLPFVSTFAAFFTRAFDQIRMARISEATIKFVGSHAGVSIGEDGASQMGLEDIAMFGAIPDSIIFHPCDGVSTAKILPLMASHTGISYLRTLRPKTPVIYGGKETFSLGGSKILRQSKEDLLTVVACGITVFEAVKAYEILKEQGTLIRVIDCYCVKPIDGKTLRESLRTTKQNTIITVEDHFEHGGLGDFVLAAVWGTGACVEKMAVKQISRSGTKDELLDYAGINAKHIVKKVKNLL